MSANAYSVIELKMIESILSNDGSNFKSLSKDRSINLGYNFSRHFKSLFKGA